MACPSGKMYISPSAVRTQIRLSAWFDPAFGIDSLGFPELGLGRSRSGKRKSGSGPTAPDTAHGAGWAGGPGARLWRV
jgi:hypothetical protein